MQVPLFLDPTIKLEKVATVAKLEEDSDRWPIEIIKMAYKQLPSLQSYELDIELDRTDAARGYAVGKLLVYPAGMTKNAAAGEDRLLSVPVIVREKEMAPLDVYSHNGQMYPMDERDMQETLSRPTTFNNVADKDQFQGTNLYGQLTPPNTDHQYNAGTIAKHASAGLWKTASENFSVEQTDAFKARLREETGLRHAFVTNEALRPYVQDLLSFKEKTASERRADRLEATKPSVVQISQSGTKFFVKTANHRCWNPMVKEASRFEIQKLLKPENFERLLADGFVTMTVDPVITEQSQEKIASVADQVGIYRVWSGPQALEGIVIPRMLTLGGDSLDSQLFFGNDRHAFQEKIAGVYERDITIMGSRPRGLGVFFYQSGDRGVAYEPVFIDHETTISHGTEKVAQYVGRRASTGELVSFLPVSGLEKIANLGNGEFGLPEKMRFLPLSGKQVKVASEADVAHLFEHQKTAGISSMTLSCTEDKSFYLSGVHDGPFRGHSYSAQEAEFVLGGLGLTGKQSKEIIKTASRAGRVRIPVTREVLTEDGRGYEMLKHAAVSVRQFNRVMPKVDLFKEAAILTGAKAQELCKQASIAMPKETVDVILSLNFVTPENASVYVNYLPLLEKSANVLAELLVASRLGMDDVRESAAKNAMTQVSAVIRGLEQLQERIQ